MENTLSLGRIEEIVNKDFRDVRRGDVRAIIHAVIGMDGVIAQALSEGQRVQVPLGTFRVRERTVPDTMRNPSTGKTEAHPRAGRRTEWCRSSRRRRFAGS